MDTVQETTLGSSGLRISSLGLGTVTWGRGTDAAEALGVLKAFADAGGTLLDLSPQALPMAGELLAKFPRGQFVLSVTSGVDSLAPLGRRVDCSRRALYLSLDEALNLLGVEAIDLWNVGHWDAHTPPSEVSSAIEALQFQGKVRYGCLRGYTGWQLAVTASPAIAAATSAYNLLERSPETELIPAAEHLGVGFIAGAPLGQGVLSGKYRAGGYPVGSRGAQPTDYADIHGLINGSDAVVEALRTAAVGLGISMATAAMAWARTRPGVAAVMATPRTVQQCAELIASQEVAFPRAIAHALDDVTL